MNINNQISILENVARELRTNTFTTDALLNIRRQPTFPKTVVLMSKREGRMTKITLSDNEDKLEVFGQNGQELQTCIRCTIATLLGKPIASNDEWFMQKYFANPDRR